MYYFRNERGQERFRREERDMFDEWGQSDEEHVHEVQGATQIAQQETYPHNHRFATVENLEKHLPA
ncbi:MAG: hypothetical protein ACOX8Q_07700 [Christensenellales bacterium]|jgi:hypothetical protein